MNKTIKITPTRLRILFDVAFYKGKNDMKEHVFRKWRNEIMADLSTDKSISLKSSKELR